MPRKPRWPPPIYTRSHGIDRCRVSFGGESFFLTLGPHGSAKAKAEYARVQGELLAGRDPRHGPPSDSLTVAELCQRFLAYAKQHYSERGREYGNFERSLAPLLRLYAALPVAEFGPKALKTVQAAMASGSWMDDDEKGARARIGKPIAWCRNVVNQRLGRIKTMFGWATEEELIGGAQIYALREVKSLRKNAAAIRQTAKVRPSTWEELCAVAAHAVPPVAAMLRLEWASGMRPGEVRIMKTESIETDCPLQIDGEKMWLYWPGHHKNDWRDGRELEAVVLNSDCREILQPWLRPGEPGRFLFQPSRGPHDHYQDDSYCRAVRRAAGKAGLRGWHAYRCRHAVKQTLMRIAGLDYARAVLRQKSVATTAAYAAQQDLQLAAMAALALARSQKLLCNSGQ